MQRAPSHFSRLIVAGVIAWIGIQASVNIGAMVGLLPLKGITLPLMSYGGSSLLFVMISLGIVYRLSQFTTHRRTILLQDVMIAVPSRKPLAIRRSV
jgi:cell division protein FtsW